MRVYVQHRITQAHVPADILLARECLVLSQAVRRRLRNRVPLHILSARQLFHEFARVRVEHVIHQCRPPVQVVVFPGVMRFLSR